MAIRDRGKLKWQPASFIPLAFEMQRSMFKDQERQSKPLIDEYEAVEFDQRICYAMKSNLVVNLTVWTDGFKSDVIGSVHHIDPISREVHFEIKPGEIKRIGLENIIGVSVMD